MFALKKYIVPIAVVITLLSLASAIKEHFFSDKERIIKDLQGQIAANNTRYNQLKSEMAQMVEEENKTLAEIEKLKNLLRDVELSIKTEEGNIDEIKGKITSFSQAVDIIAQNAQGTVSRGRGIVSTFNPGPNQ
ncbi:MAG TPA: hypothetical protein PLG50_16710 [bacterium]|nr:hypothetical protein [bacterium]HQG47302.1 hypothetical protein [bacterium]HQI47055.1 hypothetical protein [bacterium]HQJ65388.1 hypothetical protein [bacterium]